jgi:hypothetical protein
MDLQGIRELPPKKLVNLRGVLNKLADGLLKNIPEINTDNYQEKLIKNYFSKYTNKNYSIKLSVPLSEALMATYKSGKQPTNKREVLKLVENILQSDSEENYNKNIETLADYTSIPKNQLSSQMPPYETFAESLQNTFTDTEKTLTETLAQPKSEEVVETQPKKAESKEEAEKLARNKRIAFERKLLTNTGSDRVKKKLMEGDISGIYEMYINIFKNFDKEIGGEIKDIFKNIEFTSEITRLAYNNILLLERLLKNPEKFDDTVKTLATSNGIKKTEEVVAKINKQKDTLLETYRPTIIGESKTPQEEKGEETKTESEQMLEVKADSSSSETEEKEDSTPMMTPTLKPQSTPAEPKTDPSKKTSGRRPKLRGTIEKNPQVVGVLGLDTPPSETRQLTRKQRQQNVKTAGGGGKTEDDEFGTTPTQTPINTPPSSPTAQDNQSNMPPPTPANTPIKMRVSKPNVKDVPTDRLPTAIDLIPESRLSADDKTVQQLKDDIDYFYINFPVKLRKITRSKSNNLEVLKRFHKRVVAKLRGDKVERDAEDKKKMGVVIKGSEYIKDALKQIILENSIDGLSAADLLVNIEGKAEDLNDTAGSYEFITNKANGKEYASKAPVARYIPDTEPQIVKQQQPTFKPRLYRIPEIKAVVRNPVETAKRQVRQNPFLSARQPSIKLRYLY